MNGKYEFWLEIADKNGELVIVEWQGLSEKQAKEMYSMTNKSVPNAVKTFGWGLMSWGGDWK